MKGERRQRRKTGRGLAGRCWGRSAHVWARRLARCSRTRQAFLLLERDGPWIAKKPTPFSCENGGGWSGWRSVYVLYKTNKNRRNLRQKFLCRRVELKAVFNGRCFRCGSCAVATPGNALITSLPSLLPTFWVPSKCEYRPIEKQKAL